MTIDSKWIDPEILIEPYLHQIRAYPFCIRLKVFDRDLPKSIPNPNYKE